ncbi:MAG TPA: pyridoxal phosphate-dependent aminotransferase [Candidatus Acidoferrales bacterium]|nr:pyridoxal phosphate-dependent aminotransferase [Candidatus Acidoferrales bacterium]
MSSALATHRASGKPLLDLTISNPTEGGFQYDEQAIRDALSNPAVLRYEPNPKGIASARAAVTQYCAEHGAAVSLEDIFLTTSTSEAYSFAFRLLCDPGDEILAPCPSYPLFDFLADIHDVKLIHYPLRYDRGWQIDFQAIERIVTTRTRGIIVVHPNNPTGHYVKVAEMKELSAICAARELALIADEVFLDFSLTEEPLASFAANAGALTFTLSGISKISGLPQMKASWLIVNGPERWKAEAVARLEVIADTYLSINAPVQLALPAFMAQRTAFQEQLMARVRKNLAELDRQLATQQACSRLKIEGGWYAILRGSRLRDEEEFAIELLRQKGVYVHPGHFYDFSEPGRLVLPLITPERDFAGGVSLLLAKANQ